MDIDIVGSPSERTHKNNGREAHSLAEVKESPLHHLQVVKLINDQHRAQLSDWLLIT